VVVIDTELTPALRAEGDARELQRAIQDLRKEAGLDLDDEIDLRVDGLAPEVAAGIGAVTAETIAVLAPDLDGAGVVAGSVELEVGPVRIAIRRRDAGDRGTTRA
jgi:isoleucyl-tRNA synthetase